MTLINREDVLAQLRSAIDDVSKSERATDYPYLKGSGWYTPREWLEKMYDAIAALPAQAGGAVQDGELERLRLYVAHLEGTFGHRFVTPTATSDDPHAESCKQCGLNIRSLVHERGISRPLLAAAPGEEKP